MIIHENKSTLISLGLGDVYIVGCDERPLGGERNYVYLKTVEPGTIGEEEKVDRKGPLEYGDTPDIDGAVIIEASDPESVQMLIDVLVEYKASIE